MRTPAWIVAALFITTISHAGNLNVAGDLTVTGGVIAAAVTLGGETRTNWPSSGGATDLSSPVLDFSQGGRYYRYTLTNDTTWVFTNHVEGRSVYVRIAQDSNGGWINTWPSDLLWPEGQTVSVSTAANTMSVFRILDDGTYWLAQPEGLNYQIPCTTNCDYALHFDGSQNYVSCGSFPALPTEFTIEAWVKVNSYTGWGWAPMIGVNGQWIFYANGSGWLDLYLVQPDLNVQYSANDVPADGVWHHVAVVRTAGSSSGYHYRTFVDGVLRLDANNIAGGATSSGTLLLAGWNTVSGRMAGTLDLVRISNTARYTATFDTSTVMSFTMDQNTLALYKMDDGSGSTATDAAGNYTGTLTGSPLPTWVSGVTVVGGGNQMQMMTGGASMQRSISTATMTVTTTNSTFVTPSTLTLTPSGGQ